MMMRRQLKARTEQRGMVLVTALLMLIVVTLLAVSMFRSFGLDEKIAGNTREKQRALNAAETAEQYAEYWLAAGNGTPGTTCSGPASNVAQVCSNVLSTVVANVANVPWKNGGNTVGTTYSPTAPSAMSFSTTGGVGTYYQTPAFYISYLGVSPNGTLYQIDAVGYGGAADTAAVVESTYAISSSTTCKSCGQ